jgi:hypothetical protein
VAELMNDAIALAKNCVGGKHSLITHKPLSHRDGQVAPFI